MTPTALSSILSSPLSFLRNIPKKLWVPRKYQTVTGYDMEAMWRDRHGAYPFGYRSSGSESMTETDNRRLYRENQLRFMNILAAEGISLTNKSVLDVGCGNGVYAELANKNRVRSYVGLDVTNRLFPELEGRFPKFRFLQKNIVRYPSTGTLSRFDYDIVICTDVLIHIVDGNHFPAAMQNLRVLSESSEALIVSPFASKPKRSHTYHVHHWTVRDLFKHFPPDQVTLYPYRGGELAVIRR